MQSITPDPWWRSCRWTLGLCAVMALVNIGLFPRAPDALQRLVEWLQFDRQAVLQGELWRLLTGNMVHWSVEHFLLDVGAFAIMGLLYERHLRHYPWILAAAGMSVGCGMLVFLPEMGIYRGLSGVDSGQFAAALCVECVLASGQARRWLWIAPAAAIFASKILYECATGEMFFGTESLGSIGLPTPLARAAGTAAGILVTAFTTPLPRRMPMPSQYHRNVVEDEQPRFPDQGVHLQRDFSVAPEVR